MIGDHDGSETFVCAHVYRLKMLCLVGATSVRAGQACGLEIETFSGSDSSLYHAPKVPMLRTF